MLTLANTRIKGINFMDCDSQQDVEASEEQTGEAAALVEGRASGNNTAAAGSSAARPGGAESP